MTDMVFGAAPAKPGEPILPAWWRTIDRWSLAAIVGLLSSSARCSASPPRRRWRSANGLDPFYYVWRQAAFGALALVRDARRLDDVAAPAAALGRRRPSASRSWRWRFLPVFGTDFGKGAVRWYSLRVISVQPAEFLKPTFAIFAAWLMAASHDIKGPPGKALSFVVAAVAGRDPGAAARLRAGRARSSPPGR